MALSFPGGKRFAFTILDDTDDGTEASVGPVYDLLAAVGINATKTVWPVGCPEGSPIFFAGDTLDSPEYRRFVLALAERGFELAFHGATMESSERERVVRALERFRELFGSWPRVHANHAYNRDNLYWGTSRVDLAPVRWFYRLTNGRPIDWFQGHVEGSPYWWGDLCRARIDYVRNLTFDEVNLRNVNPSMPYHDPARPHVRWWFSATDVEDGPAFARTLDERAQDRLEAEGGICLVATHFGKQYVREGRVHPRIEGLIRRLASRPGWFPTVGELLDWLRAQRGSDRLPAAEWRSMQARWAWDLVRRRIRREEPLRWAA
jgi:hypothetical protein